MCPSVCNAIIVEYTSPCRFWSLFWHQGEKLFLFQYELHVCSSSVSARGVVCSSVIFNWHVCSEESGKMGSPECGEWYCRGITHISRDNDGNPFLLICVLVMLWVSHREEGGWGVDVSRPQLSHPSSRSQSPVTLPFFADICYHFADTAATGTYIVRREMCAGLQHKSDTGHQTSKELLSQDTSWKLWQTSSV